MSPAGFKPAIPASDLPQTDALSRAVTSIDPSTQYPRLQSRSVIENLANPLGERIFWILHKVKFKAYVLGKLDVYKD
jgi:hypothetical protein